MHTAKYMQQTKSGAADNGLYTTLKYLHGAVGIGLGTSRDFVPQAYASTTPRSYGLRHRQLFLVSSKGHSTIFQHDFIHFAPGFLQKNSIQGAAQIKFKGQWRGE
jgi:hypothetical protein